VFLTEKKHAIVCHGNHDREAEEPKAD